MALGLATAIRTSRATDILNAIDAGAGAGLLRIYDGSRPATGGTATTLLAELTLSDPCGSVTNGVLTFSAITQDSSANATGTATWFRIVTSAGAHVLDGSVGTSGADLNLTTTSITSGQPVQVTSLVFTEGNS